MNQLCQMLTLNASIGNVDPGQEPTLPNVDPECKYRQCVGWCSDKKAKTKEMYFGNNFFIQRYLPTKKLNRARCRLSLVHTI